jgi:hypothetical protein
VVVGMTVAAVLARTVHRGNAEPYRFVDVADSGDEVLGHVGSYLLPVVIDPSQGAGQVVLGIIVLALIILIHIATGRVHVNPMAYLFGYRVYSVSTTQGASYFLFAKGDPADWSEDRIVRCVQVGVAVLVERQRSVSRISEGT